MKVPPSLHVFDSGLDHTVIHEVLYKNLPILWTPEMKIRPRCAHFYMFPHLLQQSENTATSALRMIPVSDDALYQFQMVAQLMQKEKIIKSQPLIKHKESNTIWKTPSVYR